MRRPVIKDVLDVLQEIVKAHSVHGSGGSVSVLRREAVRAVALRELDQRFDSKESAEKSIHDACSRRLKRGIPYFSILEFDAAVGRLLSGDLGPMQGILERVNGDVDYRATLARLLATPPMQAVDFHDAAEPERRGTIVNRIIRDTAMTRELKQRYQNRCQICLSAFHLENGVTYSEAHHIRPLGEPHNGPDTEDNILILCPNHHAQCDFCAIKLVLTSLDRLPDHIIDEAHIDYHNGRCR